MAGRSQWRASAPESPASLALVALHLPFDFVSAVTHLRHGSLQLVGRDAKLLAPVAQLVVFVHVDPLAVLATRFGLVVGHLRFSFATRWWRCCLGRNVGRRRRRWKATEARSPTAALTRRCRCARNRGTGSPRPTGPPGARAGGTRRPRVEAVPSPASCKNIQYMQRYRLAMPVIPAVVPGMALVVAAGHGRMGPFIGEELRREWLEHMQPADAEVSRFSAPTDLEAGHSAGCT
jgi:hypothetical protein